MIEYASALSKKYSLTEIIQASDHYLNMNENLAEMDFYETMKYFEANSTSEFYTLISDMLVNDKPVDNNNIITNAGLLPNEQIALIMVNNTIKNNDLYTHTRATGCKEAYDTSMGTCRKWLYGSLAGSLVCAVFSFGTLSAVCAAAATIDYDRCSGAAMDTYMNCIER